MNIIDRITGVSYLLRDKSYLIYAGDHLLAVVSPELYNKLPRVRDDDKEISDFKSLVYDFLTSDTINLLRFFKLAEFGNGVNEVFNLKVRYGNVFVYDYYLVSHLLDKDLRGKTMGEITVIVNDGYVVVHSSSHDYSITLKRSQIEDLWK